MISVASSLNVEVIEIQEVRVNSRSNFGLPRHLITDCLAQVISVTSALHVEVIAIQERGATLFRSPVHPSDCNGLRRCWRK